VDESFHPDDAQQDLPSFASIISGGQGIRSNVMLLLALRRFGPFAKTARTSARKQCTKKLLAFCAAA